MAGFDENIAVMGFDWECSQTNVLGGGLSQRIASKAGYNTLRLNTDFSIESSLKSPCLTISSPGLCPATLVESPVFLSNPLGQPSPTTGKFTFLPGVNSEALSSDKEKDEFFDDIGSSSSFFQGTTEMISGDYGHYSNKCSHQGSNLYVAETDPSVENKTSDGTANTWLFTLDHQEAEGEEEEERHGDLKVSGALAEDGYNWRKYGQKLVKGSEYPRSYYKCTDPNCEMKKKIERSEEGYITEIIYEGAHNHSKPLPNRRSGIQIDRTEQVEQQRDSAATYTQQQGGSNENNIEQGSTGFEYGNQTRSGGDDMGVVDGSSTFSNNEDENDRGTQGSVSLSHDEGEGDESESKRRKLEAYAAEMRGSTRSVREARVIVETRSDIDILDDGYRWRKYGQKVVKGNPNPRSYYKCTANGCNVRKHVERASHDLKSVITSYEGKHIHDVPAARNTRSRGSSVFQSQHYYNGQQRSRFEIEATTTTNQSSFLGPPTGFSFGLCQTDLADISIPGLTFGQGNLSVMPHLYLTRSFGVREEMIQKVETVSDLGQSVYNQKILDRLP